MSRATERQLAYMPRFPHAPDRFPHVPDTVGGSSTASALVSESAIRCSSVSRPICSRVAMRGATIASARLRTTPAIMAGAFRTARRPIFLNSEHIAAAAQRAQFEIASVKVHTSDDQRVYMVAQPGGRFVAANITLRFLIRSAFQLQGDQIVGGPRWLDTDRFDIDARAPQAPGVPNSQLLEMLQTLLADRFKLTTHREKREPPVFALEPARRDGSFGPGFRSTACPELTVDLAKPQPCTNAQTGVGSLTLRGMPLHQFTPFLSSFVNRVVVDRTGLDGRYDIELKWTPDQPAQGRGGAGEPPATDPDAISIFTAIQEQLGFQLTSTRDMVDVLVIDTLEQPAPN
jgi:uncharacterized protein (TIGR03435 family)